MVRGAFLSLRAIPSAIDLASAFEGALANAVSSSKNGVAGRGVTLDGVGTGMLDRGGVEGRELEGVLADLGVNEEGVKL